MVATVFRSAGVIIGAPTYEYKLFPPVASALNELGRKRITVRRHSDSVIRMVRRSRERAC